MGNFYTNVVVRESDLDRVVSAVEQLRRRAYVAAVGGASVVYDERGDNQDLEELEKLAGKLSKELGVPALAFCNHDDDVLWYALAEGGKVVDTYDSCPGYFDGGSKTPKGGDAARLCAAFHVSDKRSAVDDLLHGENEAFTFEVERHEKLLELLGLPRLALLGYGYVSQGEVGDLETGAEVRSVGGAQPLSGAAAGASGVPGAAKAAPSIDPRALAAMQAEGPEMLNNVAALAFARVEVPDRLAGLIPAGSTNGYVILERIQQYIVTNDLGIPTSMVRPDDALRPILGSDEVPFVALARLVRENLSVPPLSAQDAGALKRGDPAFQVRFMEAIAAAAKDMRR